MKTIKIMSFNIRHGEGMDGRTDLERIAELIKNQGVDLIGLQEVDKNMPRSHLVDQTARLAKIIGYHYCYQANVKILGGRFGNGVLSKYPIITSYNQNLTSSKEPRGAVVSSVDLGGYNLKLISTHLGLVDAERLIQVSEILENINPDDKAILLGDFNATPDKPEVQKFIKEGLVDAFISWQQKLKTDEITKRGYTFAYRDTVPNVRIDYIFTTKNVEVINFKVVESYCSDHFPIIAEVRVKQ
ncbi:MAG: endonuclease/exonuclease/phosphatase family protein [Halanaerobiales bacterium]|nr:endonuclease/exonuclease/phosphatase family protein [Halanaerobiales bacterium]